MAVEAVVFDVGETLVDETQMWTRAAEAAGVTPFTLMGVLGGLIARGEHTRRVWSILDVEHPAGTWTMDDWYPDARPCIERLRACGLPRLRLRATRRVRRGATCAARRRRRLVGELGRRKARRRRSSRASSSSPASPPERIAYVGDRVDNDVGPAIAAGMVGVHIRRGPWGYLQEPPADAIRIRSLDELPGGAAVSLRVGIGVDAHALEDGVPLVLGGVRFDHPRGLAGHSDGDVLAHALTDAMLGAAGLGDIGSLFPSDDERFRGADSIELLREAHRQVREAGWRLVNADCVLIGEEPHIAGAPRRDARAPVGGARTAPR